MNKQMQISASAVTAQVRAPAPGSTLIMAPGRSRELRPPCGQKTTSYKMLAGGVFVLASLLGCASGAPPRPPPRPPADVILRLALDHVRHPAGPLSAPGPATVTCRANRADNRCFLLAAHNDPNPVELKPGGVVTFPSARPYYLRCLYPESGCSLEMVVKRFRRIADTRPGLTVIAPNTVTRNLTAADLPAELTCVSTSQCPQQPGVLERCLVEVGGKQYELYHGGIDNSQLFHPTLFFAEVAELALGCGNTNGCRCQFALNRLSMGGERLLKDQDCKTVCRGPDAQLYCTVIPGSGARFSSLLRTINDDTDGLISKKEIMDIFDETDDPCGRGDLSLVGGRIRNQGDTGCLTKFDFRVGRDELSVVLHLPRTLEGQFERSSEFLGATFANRESSPTLDIRGDSALARQLREYAAGAILEIRAEGQLGIMWVKTDNVAGCWELRFE